MKNLIRNIIAIGLAVVYCMCFSSCYTKNQAINKFCKQDTISTFVTVHDTIRTQTIQKDTILSGSNTTDTVIIQRDKMVIKYFKKDSLVYIQGTCQGDTFYITKTVAVKVPVTVPKLVWYKQYAADYWWILPSIIIFLLLMARFRKYLNDI